MSLGLTTALMLMAHMESEEVGDLKNEQLYRLRQMEEGRAQPMLADYGDAADEIERLVEALKPFAEIAYTSGGYMEDGYTLKNDFKRAAIAIAAYWRP